MFRFCLLLLMVTAGYAKADEVQQGWGFQFQQDSFDKTLFPVAMMAEDGDSYDRANLFIACDKGGKLAAFFQPGMISFERDIEVQFRDAGRTTEFNFKNGEIAHLGTHLRISAEETESLLAIFERANGTAVPFKAKNTQGQIPSIAAKQTFAIMRSNCPT